MLNTRSVFASGYAGLLILAGSTQIHTSVIDCLAQRCNFVRCVFAESRIPIRNVTNVMRFSSLITDASLQNTISN